MHVDPTSLEHRGGSSLLPRGEERPFTRAHSQWGLGEKRQKRNFKLSKKVNKGKCTKTTTITVGVWNTGPRNLDRAKEGGKEVMGDGAVVSVPG